MLSAYLGYQVVALTGSFWLALLLAPLGSALVGVAMERFLLRRVHAFGHMGELILTVGVGSIVLAAVKSIWGTENLQLKMPAILSGRVSVAGLEYPVYRLFIIGLALVILAVMTLLLYRTRLGKIVRAAVSDAGMVNALGINIPLVFMLVFGVGVWMAGVAGVAIAPILTVFPGLADQVGMDAFIVVVTGGFGSLAGAFIVSLIFGLLSSYGELQHAIESDEVQRYPVQLEWLINQGAEIDHYQPLLFIVDSFEHLFDLVNRLEQWMRDGKLYNVAPGLPEVNEHDLRSFIEAGDSR